MSDTKGKGKGKGEKKAAKGKGKGGKGKGGKGKGAKSEKHELGITASKATQFPDWYTQVITKAELIEYYDISGCYILRPTAFALWESVKEYLDTKFKKSGVKNCYFPLLVSKAALEAEESHIAGFSPEVAWVTKGGQSDLETPVAIRPTSETIMYPTYSKWIRSHRDLPMRLNQWSNVVRWEFKAAVPFIRSREFLWQEGHTAFATKPEADKEVLEILDYYRGAYEEVFAVPVIKGMKTEEEKFAGGLYTTTIETFINGRGIQAATSHCLGQNFAKIFDIKFEGEAGTREMVWQNSWGFTTRSIGVMIMVHSDDKGLVLPPRCAPIHVVIVPIFKKKSDNEALRTKALEIQAQLKKLGIKTEVDLRDNHNPGFKYNFWELRGVPLRLDIGDRDLKKGSVFACRRDNGKKFAIPFAELAERVPAELASIQGDLFLKAKKNLDEHIVRCTEWEQVVPALNKGCLVLAPWDTDNADADDLLKKKSSEDAKAAAAKADSESGFMLTAAAKTLCIPMKDSGYQPDLPEGAKCIVSGAPAKKWILLGRSY